MNLANKLTLFRIVLVPFFVIFLLVDNMPYNYFLALVVFIIASITDQIDGQIARERDMITDFGKFLDPLADKILTVSALICFIELDWIMSWTVIIIVTREFIVSGIRLVAASGKDKTVISADFSGKLKTAATMISIIIILVARVWLMSKQHLVFSSKMGDADFYFNASTVIKTMSEILMYIVAFLTVWSGTGYVWKYRSIFKGKV